MYKIKIINYQPYEYELLQQKLNNLGLQGFQCQDLSLISFFKKVDHPVFYKIDFYKPEGHSRLEKNNNQNHFYDYYLERDYYPIYSKRGMHVFRGKKELITKRFEENLNIMTPQKRLKALALFILLFIVTIFITMFSIEAYSINTWLTYGITIANIGLFIALFTILYRQYLHFYYYSHLVHKTKYSLSRLKLLRQIYIVGICLSSLMIGGGLIEDFINAKTFTPQDHPVILLKDLGFQKETKQIAQVKSSFTVPHYYTILETLDDETVLLTKEYALHSSQEAQNLLKNFKNNPNDYLCTSIQEKNNVIYGYHQDVLTTLLLQKEERVIMISFSFEPSQQQLDTILQFYQV